MHAMNDSLLKRIFVWVVTQYLTQADKDFMYKKTTKKKREWLIFAGNQDSIEFVDLGKIHKWY